MLFRLAEVSKHYGAQDVLRAVSFQINPGEKVGLVGRNGAGKTTIFRLITGEEMPDHGAIEKMRGLRLGILSQHVDFKGAGTVMEAALSVFDNLRSIENKMRELEHLMTVSTGSELSQVMHEYSDLQHEFEREDGFTTQSRAEAVLLGLGFTKEEFNKASASLSGGEKNRLGLVRLLLQQPDILLLDEPTNHLDVEAVEWLEDFLSEYKSAYIIISHDRFFLDHTVTRILELENGRVDTYSGNYSKYLEERELRRQQQIRTYEQQQEMIAKTEDFIRRNIAGQKTKQARSRRKMLEKIERVESAQNLDTTNFQLKPVTRTGNQVLILKNLSVGYPTKTLATGITLTLRRGERLGIIGGNGTGKTTLLRTIIGKHREMSGEMRWGTGVNFGYYDQQLRLIDEANDVINELRTVAPSTITDGELRSFLARFLFVNDDVFKPVSALSGGEKGRLSLSKLIWSRLNVLVLDEPTNHLDIASCEALEEALNEYDGTIITVSHDRYFLDRIATHILFFGESGVEFFDGGYSEFYEAHHRTIKEAAEAAKEAVRAEEAAKRAAQQKAEAAKNGASKNSKSKRRQISPEKIEQEIHQVEAEMQQISTQMLTEEIARDHLRLLEMGNQYQLLEEKLQQLYQTWETALSES
jgi:ATP-binding cassette subfamily F protein 3